MPLPYPRPIPAQIRAVLGDDELVPVEPPVTGVERLRPARPGRAVVVLHARPPGQRELEHEVERILWLGGRANAPEVIGTGRAAEGDEMAVVRMPVGAVPASSHGHGLDPANVAAVLAESLRDLHLMTADDAPLAPDLHEMRAEAAHRVANGLVTQRPDGPYRSDEPERLLATLDILLDELGPAEPVMTHGAPTLDNLWIAPDHTVGLTGWSRGGSGDAHRDLAVASRSLAEVFGGAVVAPFLDVYGLDDVDLRRLDAHQLLDHLLT